MTREQEAAEWLTIPGFPGYKINIKGEVLSIKRKNPLIKKTKEDKDGYLRVGLSSPHRRSLRNVGIHQLMCRAFHGEPLPGQMVRHLDGNNKNNHPSNLRWGTVSENVLDSVKHGTHGAAKLIGRITKPLCPYGHEKRTRMEAGKIRRFCAECFRIRHLVKNARIKGIRWQREQENAMLKRVVEAAREWMELEDDTKPWFGKDDYFNEYDKRFNAMSDALKALDEAKGK